MKLNSSGNGYRMNIRGDGDGFQKEVSARIPGEDRVRRDRKCQIMEGENAIVTGKKTTGLLDAMGISK